MEILNLFLKEWVSYFRIALKHCKSLFNGFSIKTPKIVEIPYEGANNLLKKGQFVEVNMVQHQGEFQDIKIGKVLDRQPLG